MIELLTTLTLPQFPSGSSINYYNHRFYLIGDDANDILVLDENYQILDAIRIFDFKETRIPKAVKADFETSCIVEVDGQDQLLILGSASRSNRCEGVLLPLNETLYAPSRFMPIHFDEFISRLKDVGEINIEGSTVIGNRILLSNRANNTNRHNQLIITESDFWKRQADSRIVTLKIILPTLYDSIPGISELCYVASQDVLLLVLSSESTTNAYDDGSIGDSYIGWVNNASVKINGKDLRIDGMINLSQGSDEFKGEKIEGICVELADSTAMILHLISDNDDGKSRLFKLKMILP